MIPVSREQRTVENTLLLVIIVLVISLFWNLLYAMNLLDGMESTTLRYLNTTSRLTPTGVILLFLLKFIKWIDLEGKLPEVLREGSHREFDVTGVAAYITTLIIPIIWFFLIPNLESMNKRTAGIRDANEDYVTVIFSWCLILVGTLFYSIRRIIQTNGRFSSYLSTLILGLIPTTGGVFTMIMTWMSFYSGREDLWYILIPAAPLIFIFISTVTLWRTKISAGKQ